MPIISIFSKRQKQQRGEVPDVYQYESIPHELRVQIIQILEKSFGYNLKEMCAIVHKGLSHEYGVFRLGGRYESDDVSVFNFFLKTKETCPVVRSRDWQSLYSDQGVY